MIEKKPVVTAVFSALRYTALLLYTQLCFKSTFLSKLTNRECFMVIYYLYHWMTDSCIRAIKRVTWPMNNSTMCTVTCRVSRKAKRSRSLNGLHRIVRILPLACAFKSTNFKLLLGYLLMNFVCDVIITVSFKVSFPHLYVLEVWQNRMRLCYKR